MLYNYLCPELANLTSLPTRLTSRGTAGERLGHYLSAFREESDNLLRRQTLSSLFFVSKKQFNGMGCSFTPSFKGSPSLFVTVGLSPYVFCFFALILVADLSSTLSDDSCIAVSLSLALAHVSSFPRTSVQLFLRSVPVLPCVSSCLHSHWRMALTLDPGLLDALPCIFLWTAFCSVLYTLPLFIGLPA